MMISISNVSRIYSTKNSSFTALDNVSVNIAENEFFTLLGPSGCGKTTLLRTIAGFDSPSSGTIKLQGTDLISLPPYKRPVNTVFQNYSLFPHMSVAKNIAFGLEMLGKPAKEINETVDRMLDLVQMQAMRDRLTSQISGGQQQRVALARALAPAPKVLLLDEPLSALDYKLRKEMQIELKRLQHETGITFIFVTHDQEEALTMSDRIAVLNAGKILQIGSAHDIYERPADRFVAGFIGETNFLQGAVQDTNAEATQVRLGESTVLSICQNEQALSKEQQVTLAIRPEHIRLTAPEENNSLTGTLENIVYLGTDTHFHIELAGQPETLVVRRQNDWGGSSQLAVGDTVGIRFNQDAVRILRD